jgi:hypothetical protein
VQFRHEHLAVEHIEPGSYEPAIAIALPLSALVDFEGREQSPVVIETLSPGRTVVHWTDRGIPQTREYDTMAPDAMDSFPEAPQQSSPSTPALLEAMAAATRTSDDDSQR